MLYMIINLTHTHIVEMHKGILNKSMLKIQERKKEKKDFPQFEHITK